jgi:hypothetical protein
MDREAELRAIDAFIEARGVTHCPPAYAAQVYAVLPLWEEMRRVALFRPER